MDIKLRNKLIEIKNSISDHFNIFVTKCVYPFLHYKDKMHSENCSLPCDWWFQFDILSKKKSEALQKFGKLCRSLVVLFINA